MFGQYCLPTYGNACTSGDMINSFSLNTISNLSTGCGTPGANNYTDYSGSISTSLVQGATYSVSCSSGPSWGQYFAVWIDFNQDGDFDEVNEFFDIGYAAGGATITTPITLPSGVLNGTTRLRVLCHFGTGIIAQTDACAAQTWGEVEDYTVVITPATPSISTVFIAGTLDTITGLGDTLTNTCTQDGNPDIITLDNISTSGANYSYILTDNLGNILALPSTNTGDFDVAPPGNCRIYGVSHTGVLDSAGALGMNVLTATLSADPFIVSNNYVEVIRWENNVAGGMVNTLAGDTSVTTCTQDGNPDVVLFNTTSVSPANYAYIITFADDTVRAIPGNSFDFDGVPPGTCRVFGVSYNGDFDSTVVGTIITNAAFSNGCYELSSNYIEIIRLANNTDTSSVSEMTTNATTVNLNCVGNGVSDLVQFTNLTASTASYAYIVTDATGNILAFPPNGIADFDGAGIGNCRVYGVSYNGTIDTLLTGTNINTANLTNACFTLSSNWIDIVRSNVDGATIASPAATLDSVFVTIDAVPDVITFTNTSMSSGNYTYVITDDNNNIIGFNTGGSMDFNSAGAGICYMYGLSYEGILDTTVIGSDITSTILALDCYDISTNFIVISRTLPLSINDINSRASVSIYPIPAEESIKIKGLANGTYNIRVINTLGAVVIETTEYQTKTDVNISKLEAGVYIINIIDQNKGTSSHRFIKK